MISTCGAGTRGIIPAYAGSTSPGSCRRGGLRDHPRIRGEHNEGFLATAGGEGSSPHTRGALVVGELVALERRIIPAYAGSTRSRPSRTIL